MIKNEADIIRANLTWLYYAGVRRFAIMDNASDDRTAAEVRCFQAQKPDVELLLVHDPIVRHIQGKKTSGLSHLARCVWQDVDWILPFDADEFIIPRFGLRALAHVPEDVLALTLPKVVHFWPRDKVVVPKRFEGMTLRCAPFIVPPKVVFRARMDLDVSQGNHRVTSINIEKVRYAGGLQFGFYHREFQTRSFAQFLRKVQQGGRAIHAARAIGFDAGGGHWLDWYEKLQAGGKKALQAEFKEVAFRSPGLHMVEDPFHWALDLA